MTNLVDFAKRLELQPTLAQRKPHSESDEASGYMTAIAGRREKVESLSSELIEMVIQPRLETLAGVFSTPSLSQNEPAGRCLCCFRYCEQFPASTKVALAVEHDVRIEKIVAVTEDIRISSAHGSAKRDSLASRRLTLR